MKQPKSRKIKFPISLQIALTFLVLLITVIGVCIFVNSSFLEEYYVKNKQEALKSAYSLINESALNGNYDSSDLSFQIQSICDIYNLNILVLDESTNTVISSMKDSDIIQRQLFENIFGKFTGIDDTHTKSGAVLEETDTYTIQINSDIVMQEQYIEMWGLLDNGYIFLMRSAIESINESVKIANKFLVFIGIGAGLVSILISLWASKIISKPIIELTEISERMRNLEFDAKYHGDALNEVGILGANINELSESLESTISELRTANNQLERDLEHKTELEEMRKEFLSNVSHELKTPISLIQGYAEGLKECVADDDESREFYCDVIVDEAAKMNGLVQKLLTLNQLESGNDVVSFERFDIVQLVKSYLQSVDILIKGHDAQVQIEYYDPIYVWADQFRAYEVFSNYFTNALNHLDGDRKIDIAIIKQTNSVRISVFNSGSPIPDEALEHIWEKFYKVDKARTREYGGSGVGLSIVKAIQDSINQPYGVKNYNNGVEFYFELAI